MKNQFFIILPNQLFEIKHLDKKYNYIIWEHPHYFKSYNFNKKKLMIHRASMKYYFDYLIKNNYKVKYYNFNNKIKETNYIVFDPIDKINLPNKYTIIESPNFILNKEIYKEYRNKTDKFFFNSFYMWSKKKINVLSDIKSTDKDNRHKFPKNLNLPKLPNNKKKDIKYIKESINYINNNFNTNYGNTDNFIYPISHNSANNFLSIFLKERFDNFGKYEDAISDKEPYAYHSVLSCAINIGLLNPSDIIKLVIKQNTTMNNIEGYIRQLFWREYQRYCYIYFDFKNKNYFGNNSKLTKKWYNGTTGILPLDNCINNAFNNAYLHHIERLMIVGNYMNLSNIHPMDGLRWFMEFSCDSYEWVMYQNVLEMVFFVSGGGTMRRPYISSSNYILKMSNYKKGDWCEIWNNQYREFINNHIKELYKFRYYVKLPKK
jgi:deoxyribodipyrimidine photolyase-related protein